MKASKKITALLCALLSTQMLCGCSMLQFEDPQEIQRQEQEIEAQTKIEYPDAQALYDPEKLVMDESLTEGSTGRVLAVYQARFPWFEADDFPALQNINAYYKKEFEALTEDKTRFFSLVEQRPSAVQRSAIFTSELLESPKGYISILRKYESVDTLDKTSTRWFCEIFSAATGLSLRFDNLFGPNGAEAKKQVRESLVLWTQALEGEIGPEWIDKLSDADLTANVAIGNDSLYILLPAGAAPNDAQLIELPLSDFEAYLTGSGQ